MAGLEGELSRWHEAYKRAWEDLDPQAAAELFTEDGTYAWGPFEEPLRGREAIRARWAEVTAGQSNVSFGYELLGELDAGGISRWWCSFDVEGARIELDGIFIVALTGDGLCSEFREWWNERVTPAGGQ